MNDREKEQKSCKHTKTSTNRTPTKRITWCTDCGKVLSFLKKPENKK